MTKTKGLLFTASMVLAMAFTLSCDSGGGGGGGGSSSSVDGGNQSSSSDGNGGGGGGNVATSGSITITDIPSQYNGKYMSASGFDQAQTYTIFAYESFTNVAGGVANPKYGTIEDGTVTLKVWKKMKTTSADIANFNESGLHIITLTIANSQAGTDVIGSSLLKVFTFAEGKATVSYDDFGWPNLSSNQQQ